MLLPPAMGEGPLSARLPSLPAPREGGPNLTDQVPGHANWVKSASLLVGRMAVCSKLLHVGTEVLFSLLSLKAVAHFLLGSQSTHILLAFPLPPISLSLPECGKF